MFQAKRSSAHLVFVLTLAGGLVLASSSLQASPAELPYVTCSLTSAPAVPKSDVSGGRIYYYLTGERDALARIEARNGRTAFTSVRIGANSITFYSRTQVYRGRQEQVRVPYLGVNEVRIVRLRLDNQRPSAPPYEVRCEAELLDVTASVAPFAPPSLPSISCSLIPRFDPPGVFKRWEANLRVANGKLPFRHLEVRVMLRAAIGTQVVAEFPRGAQSAFIRDLGPGEAREFLGVFWPSEDETPTYNAQPFTIGISPPATSVRCTGEIMDFVPSLP